MELSKFLKEKQCRVEQELATCFSRCSDVPDGLLEAMRYSLEAGGKRLRPALVLGACEMVCGDDAPALPAACALEMIHTYSLIHDDLPAMDNDDFRRGKPTSHKQFGEAVAILAGDALLTQAFYEISRSGNVQAVLELSEAAGAAGMVGGQYRDMKAEGRLLTLDELRVIHAGKTGALITVALRLGVLLGNGSEKALRVLTEYGHNLGLLFQITDDILDVVGDAALLGKSTGKDSQTGKATYPAIVGLETARAMARAAANNALQELRCLGPEADVFRALTHYLLERDH